MRFGPLDPIMSDPSVTDVAVTGDGTVWTDRGCGMVREIGVPTFRSPRAVREFAVGLCAQMGCRLDDASPIADAASPEGVRVNAVIAPLVPDGASLSIRVQPRDTPGLDALAGRGMMPLSWLPLLRSLVRCRANILIIGGTGSGKTTLMRALLAECGGDERVVSVEEVRELGSIGVANHVPLATRNANVEGAGAVGLADLVRASLRMRPDRIVVGECRGAELGELIRALNSGHRGGMTTMHANGIDAVGSRIVSLGLLAGMSPRTTAMMAREAFDVVLHIDRVEGRRWLAGVGILVEDAGDLTSRMVLRWVWRGPSRSEFARGDGWPEFAARWCSAPDSSGGSSVAASGRSRSGASGAMAGAPA